MKFIGVSVIVVQSKLLSFWAQVPWVFLVSSASLQLWLEKPVFSLVLHIVQSLYGTTNQPSIYCHWLIFLCGFGMEILAKWNQTTQDVPNLTIGRHIMIMCDTH